MPTFNLQEMTGTVTAGYMEWVYPKLNLSIHWRQQLSRQWLGTNCYKVMHSKHIPSSVGAP